MWENFPNVRTRIALERASFQLKAKEWSHFPKKTGEFTVYGLASPQTQKQW